MNLARLVFEPFMQCGPMRYNGLNQDLSEFNFRPALSPTSLIQQICSKCLLKERSSTLFSVEIISTLSHITVIINNQYSLKNINTRLSSNNFKTKTIKLL